MEGTGGRRRGGRTGKGRGRGEAGGGNAPGGAAGDSFSSAGADAGARTSVLFFGREKASEREPIPSEYRGLELCIREQVSWPRGG